VKEGLDIYKELFSCKVFGISKLSRHINHFGISLKQTCSEEIQVIYMDRFSEAMKTFVFCENMKGHFVGKKSSNFNLRVI
jgi:hypothetical protein